MDFLPINVSITDVLAGISAAVGTVRSYLCDTSICHEGTPRYDEANIRKWETGTSNGLVHFNFWIGCLDEDHSAVEEERGGICERTFGSADRRHG